jgi:hypothetical protein
MDHDTSLLTRLKEEARLRQQQHAASRTANQAMTPQVKMIVSDWYTDEIGNQARIIKACKERAARGRPQISSCLYAQSSLGMVNEPSGSPPRSYPCSRRVRIRAPAPP